MIKLSQRLKIIADYIEDDSKIIDIGCDHALLDIYLSQTKTNLTIIASDINKNALNQAKNNIKKYNLESKIETRLGDGLEVITKEEIDTIIISGLGANKIVNLLVQGLDKLDNVKQLIIQSNTSLEYIRKNIVKLGYYIKNEQQIKENGLIYTIINFKKGRVRYNKRKLYFGPILLKNKDLLFEENNKKELAKLNALLRIIPKREYLKRFRLMKEIKLYKKK